MLDTLRVQCDTLEISPAIMDFLQSEYPTATFHKGQFAPGLMWEGASWQDPRLGVMGIKSNRTGNYLWAERSLGKYAYGDNCRQLSYSESMQVADQWITEVHSRFDDFINPGCRQKRQVWKPTRTDWYYQRQVDSSAAVCVALAHAFPQKGKLAQYLTSLEVMQSRDFRGRFYDKGVESKRAEYNNVLRHEEQIRSYDRAGYYLDIQAMKCDTEAVRQHMNKRFQGWPEGGVEVDDVAGLLRDHGSAGMAAALMVLVPSVEPLAKERLSKDAFYKYRRLANDYRQRKVNIDLRVPAGSWED